jgi:hypothetical protein
MFGSHSDDGVEGSILAVCRLNVELYCLSCLDPVLNGVKTYCARMDVCSLLVALCP